MADHPHGRLDAQASRIQERMAAKPPRRSRRFSRFRPKFG